MFDEFRQQTSWLVSFSNLKDAPTCSREVTRTEAGDTIRRDKPLTFKIYRLLLFADGIIAVTI